MEVLKILTEGIIGIGLIFLGLIVIDIASTYKKINRIIAIITGVIMIAIGVAFELVILKIVV